MTADFHQVSELSNTDPPELRHTLQIRTWVWSFSFEDRWKPPFLRPFGPGAVELSGRGPVAPADGRKGPLVPFSGPVKFARKHHYLTSMKFRFLHFEPEHMNDCRTRPRSCSCMEHEQRNRAVGPVRRRLLELRVIAEAQPFFGSVRHVRGSLR